MRTRLFIAALCAAAGFTACNIAPEQPELTEYTLTVEASMPEPDTKGLALDGTKLNAVWTSDDQVIVLDGTTQVGTLTPQSTGSATAVLKGTLTQSVSVGKALTLQTPRKSWAYNSNQDGTLSSVSSKLAYARAGITVTAVNGSEISAGTAHFENQQAIVKFTLKNDKGSILTVDKLTVEAASKKLVRTLGAAASYGSIAISNTGKATSIFAALRNDSGAADTYTLTATIGNDVYHCTKSGVLFENGKYYNVTATISEEVHTYTIVGAPIFGSTWNREDSSNDLVKQGNIYKSKVYKVTNDPTSVEFKIVKDHDYSNGEWPASNYSVTAGVGDFYVEFDPSKNDAAAITVHYSPAQNKDTYTVAGASNGTAAGQADPVFTKAWTPTETANDMVLQSDGTYVKTYTSVAANTELKFKIVVNHSNWKYGGANSDLGSDNDGNCVYKKTSAGTVKIVFNPKTEKISVL